MNLPHRQRKGNEQYYDCTNLDPTSFKKHLVKFSPFMVAFLWKG